MSSKFDTSIVTEISQLYELSLSIKNNLEIEKICDNFLTVLMRQKGFDYCSVWIKNEHLFFDVESDYTNVFALPATSIVEDSIVENPVINSIVSQNKFVGINCQNKNFEFLIQERNITRGIYWIIPLEDVGYIKLYFSHNNYFFDKFSEFDLKKLEKVFRKFAFSLQACLLFHKANYESEEKKKVQKELKKLAVIAQKTQNLIFILDKFGKIEWVNEGFSNATCYSLSEVKGKKPSEFLFEKNGEADRRIKTILEKHKRANLEIQNTCKNGKVLWVDLNIQPVFDDDNNLINYIFVESDISKKVEKEKELLEARENAESLAQIKQDFLSIISHEIRTPLNAILGLSELSQNRVIDPLSLEYINGIKSSADNLMEILNGILDFSDIERGKLNLKHSAFNLLKTCEHSIDKISDRAKEKGLNLEFYFDSKIIKFCIGDSIRLSQVLLNLLNNAVKFSNNGTISLKIKLIKETKNFYLINFSIKDQGIGISRENQQLIFESFTQEDSSTSRKFGGAGLGLTITRKLLSLMGSEIEVSSKLNVGSEFKFDLKLPVKEESKFVPKSNFLKKSQLQGYSILLVEDNKLNQLFAKKVLEDLNLRVEVAENGLEGLEKFKKEKFDLILMDLQMPEMDGILASKEIRKIDKQIPIIALTALTANNTNDYIKAGMNDFLAKPYLPDDLEKIICKNIVKKKNPNQNENLNHYQEKKYELNTLSDLLGNDKNALFSVENEFIDLSNKLVSLLIGSSSEDSENYTNEIKKIRPLVDLLKIEDLKKPLRQLENDSVRIHSKSVKHLKVRVINLLREVCDDMQKSQNLLSV